MNNNAQHWIAFQLNEQNQLWLFGPYNLESAFRMHDQLLKTRDDIALITEIFQAVSAGQAERIAHLNLLNRTIRP